LFGIHPYYETMLMLLFVGSGGAAVELAARRGNPNSHTNMRVPMREKINCDFSYAGKHSSPNFNFYQNLKYFKRFEEFFPHGSLKSPRASWSRCEQLECPGQSNARDFN